MAITAFTGPPGSGKSHALIKDVILPALAAGRRVLTNIDGLDPDACRAHLLDRGGDPDKLGAAVVFHGEDALKAGFFPDEATESSGTVVQPGDLLVFDEWALYFPRRGNWPAGCNVEAFLRWHRHLTSPEGVSTDVAIGTQLATDVHQNVRGLIVKSYKFRKLTALGSAGSYTWQLFEGHLQPKGGYYRTGTGTYDKAIFPLYASSSGAKEGNHVELKTNAKESILSGWQAWGVMIGAPVLLLGGAWFLYDTFSAQSDPAALAAQSAAPTAFGGPSAPPQAPAVADAPWRIVGIIDATGMVQVVVSNRDGATRILPATNFEFENGRAVSGLVDGQRAIAEDRPDGVPSASPFAPLKL